MNVSFVLPSLGINGGVRVVLEYGNRLENRGHNVTILSSVVPRYPYKEIKSRGLLQSFKKFLSARDISAGDIWEIKPDLVTLPYLSPKSLKLYEHRIPDGDVIIATEWRTVEPIAKLNDSKGEKWQFFQHYEADIWEDPDLWNQAIEQSARTNERPDVQMIDIASKQSSNRRLVDRSLSIDMKRFTISEYSKRVLENFGIEPEGVISNGIDHNVFYKDEEPDFTKILAPYRDAMAKGTDDAIEAFKIVRKNHPSIEFSMFGPTDADLPDWIEYHSSISDDELRNLYSSHGIFLFPSWMEGFGLPVAEAMACESAVVSTEVGGIPDFTTDGYDILFTERMNSTMMANNISHLIENETIAKQLAKRGKNTATDLQWEESIDKFENIVLRSDKY